MVERFIMISVASVILTTWMMQIIPTSYRCPGSHVGAVFGGVLIGIGSGITLRIGGSSGGFDIVGLILTRKYDFPLGTFLSSMNGIVIVALGYFKNNWDLALFSMLAIYISGKTVDIDTYSPYQSNSVHCNETKGRLLTSCFMMPRGVTLIKTEGAYTKQQHDMLMTVTTRYELVELKRIIKED